MKKSFDEISEQLSFLNNRTSTTRIGEDGRIIRNGDTPEECEQETSASLRRKDLASILREQKQDGYSYDSKSCEARREKIAQALRGEDVIFDDFK